MRKLLPALLMYACLPVLAQTLNDKIDKDDVAIAAKDDPAMLRAFQRARASLDEFLAKAKSPPAGQTDHALKVGISEGGRTEYFWIIDFRARGADQFEGEIANDPRIVKTVRLGDRYTFKRDRIVDWTYIDAARKKTMGNFTMCALLTKESKAEADAVMARFNIDCD